MPLNLGRWFKYAQAKLDQAVSDGNDELDQLEAKREAELADKPWLADDGEVPTFENAKARIEREARDADVERGASPIPDAHAPRDPSPDPAGDLAGDAEVAAARVELERREHEAATRLDAIRAELGIDRHDGPPDATEPPGPGSP